MSKTTRTILIDEKDIDKALKIIDEVERKLCITTNANIKHGCFMGVKTTSLQLTVDTKELKYVIDQFDKEGIE